jgi:hypothetical protein
VPAAVTRASVERWQAMSDQKKWAMAQKADSEGDLRTASQLYMKLALRRSPHTAGAKQRLAQIQSAAGSKWKALEGQLTQISGREAPVSSLHPVGLDAEQVTQVFAEMDKLAEEYAGVATVDNQIEQRLKKLRKDPQYAAVLQEPAAADLWSLAQEYEASQQACCAVVVYEQAAAMKPAPSAERAKARLAVLQADPEVVAATKRCRDLQLCHEHFRRAELIKSHLPDQARDYYSKILAVAPTDTPIYQAAREQIAMLK